MNNFIGYILYVLCIHNSNLGLGLQAPVIHEWEWDKRKLKTQTRIQFWPATIITSMPQVKIQFLKLKMFSPRLILYFLCLLALIFHELGLGQTEETESRPRLKKFNLNIILTCNKPSGWKSPGPNAKSQGHFYITYIIEWLLY